MVREQLLPLQSGGGVEGLAELHLGGVQLPPLRKHLLLSAGVHPRVAHLQARALLVRPVGLRPGLEVEHAFLVHDVELVDFALLRVGAVLDVGEGQGSGDGDVLDAGHVETPALLEYFGHEGRDVPLAEDVHDLVSAVLALAALPALRAH